MTSSQPPPPPGGHGEQPQGAPPPYGQQPGQASPPQPPPYGQPPQAQQPPPYGQPPYGQPPYGQPGYAPPQPGYGPPPGFGQPAGGTSFDLKRLKMADYVIAGATVLYLVWAILPWVSLGNDFFFSGISVSGFGFSGLVTFSFVLFLLATAWAVLPAFTDVKVGFPRGWITVGVGGLGLVLTLIAWISSLSYGFSIWALLALITAAAITAFAFLRLLPELGHRPGLPGGLAGAAQWANQQAPNLPGGFGQPGQPGHPGQPGRPDHPGQQGPSYGPPQQYGQPGPYVPPQPGPGVPPPPYAPPGNPPGDAHRP